MNHDDEQLAARSVTGDREAFATLLERHLHPAWRIALATLGSSHAVDAAHDAVVTGVCDAVLAAGRQPDPTRTLRTRIAGAVHRAAAEGDRGRRAVAPAGTDPVLAAFATLPAASRAALWLVEVEGGNAEQVAPVLGLDRGATAALADRAGAALRDRLAADAASQASDPACVDALRKLPAQAAGRLTEYEREQIGQHVAACGACAAWLAATVAPRAALRGLVVPMPAGLATAVAERWAERPARDGLPWLRGWSDRAVGAAAAAVLAVGLAGAAVLGRDGNGRGPELAAPAGSVAEDTDGGDPVLADPAVAAPSTVASFPGAAPLRASGTTSTGSTAGSAERPRGTSPTLGRRDTPTTSTTAAPRPAPTPTTSTTAPPAGDTGGDAPADTVEETGTQVTVDLGEATIGIGDDTGITIGDQTAGDAPASSGEPTIELQLPGLPPITLP